MVSVMTLLIFQQYLKLYVQKIRNIIFSSSPHEVLIVIKTDHTVNHKLPLYSPRG